MISMPNSAGTPIGGPAAYAPPAPAEDTAVADTPTTAPAAGVAGDPLVRFGADHGLHPQVQQFAYASPNGPSGGASATPTTSTDAQRAQAQTLMDAGVKLLKAGKFDAAIERFQAGYRLVPSPNFILNEAAALRDSGRYAEAAVAYEKYLGEPDITRADDARKALDDVRTHLGGRSYSAADIAEAKRLTDEGAKAFREGRIEDAYRAWGDAYERNPIPARLFDQAICMQRLGANYTAARLFHAYAVADPKPQDAAAVSGRGDRLLERARNEPITAVGYAGGKEWIARGNELLHARRYSEAVAAYEEGFRTFPDQAFILNKASALLDGGRYAEADLAYGTYLSNPDAPRADEARAAQLRAREHMGGREATITGVAESQRLMSDGAALYKAGRYADALQAFDRAYALNPLPELRYNQAACLEKMGAREIAATRYADYLREAPHAADADKVRGHITQLHDAAKAAAREAFDRGQQAFLAGDFKGAASAFAEAYSHLPLPEFLSNRGEALAKAGDAMGAVRSFQLYLNMTPHAPDAAKVRARIETLLQASGNALMKPVDEKLQAAQRAFDAGTKAFEQGRWTDAARHFSEAYASKPFPQFLYNVGASLDKAGDTMGAVKAYQQYLNAMPNADDADKVRARIQTLLERSGDALMRP
ncbi:MAG TPA: tetratricopeptide repeat protein [Burkholderiaceae bacterium]|nr:tetratricopeptide repeat protein [Burkholderiaceae bacterium]